MSEQEPRHGFTLSQLLHLPRLRHSFEDDYDQPVGRWLHDADGLWRPGTAAIYLDNALGNDLIARGPGRTRGLVTSGLSMEFAPRRSPGSGPLSVQSSLVHLDAHGGIARGDLHDADGAILATSTLSGRFTPAVATSRLSYDVDQSAGHAAERSTERAVGPDLSLTGIIGATPTPTPDGAHLTITPGPWLSNVRGGLHGGMTAAVLEYVAATSIGPAQWLTSSLRVDFLRPTPLDRALTARAVVVKRGRSVAFVRATLSSDDTEPLSLASMVFLAS